MYLTGDINFFLSLTNQKPSDEISLLPKSNNSDSGTQQPHHNFFWKVAIIREWMGRGEGWGELLLPCPTQTYLTHVPS